VQGRNPYATPRARVADAEDDAEFGEIKIFSATGRLGRVRYIDYQAGLGFLWALVLAALAGVAGAASPVAVAGVTILGHGALLTVLILLAIQRAHDFDSSGWLSLLVFVPLVSLIFWFIPGRQGENRFGKRPPPNTTGVIVLACVLPVIFVLGIVAAIAIPAYQNYAHRAQQTQISQGR
jgi:uncharacterized membrane protein YhaH (DUF805 family)